MSAEIAFYLGHNGEGRDRRALADLRRRCAAVLREAIGVPVASVTVDDLLPALLAALRFDPLPGALGALARLRAAGLRLVAVSNWDVSLHDVLAQTGLAGRLDGAVTSAEAGAAKPDPAIFARALSLAAVPARDAVHVGDSPATDVDGARAAGIRPVLVAAPGAAAGALPDVPRIASVGELVGWWA